MDFPSKTLCQIQNFLLILCVSLGSTQAKVHAAQPHLRFQTLAPEASNHAEKSPVLCKLRLGVSSPPYPPFDLVIDNQFYEGIGADYAQLLSKRLNCEIEILGLNTREDAIKALQTGAIDLLGNSNSFEASHERITLSRPYIADRPTLSTRQNFSGFRDKKSTKLRIAVSSDYLPLEQVQSRFPDAQIIQVPSPVHAMTLLVYGKAEAMLSELQVASYLIERDYPNAVKIVQIDPPLDAGVAFAMNANNAALLDKVNLALSNIHEAEHELIARRWNAGQWMGDGSLSLSAHDLQWIKQAGVIQVAVDRSSPPLSYFDEHGTYRGITADLLARIALETGLEFEFNAANSLSEALQMVSENTAHVVVDLNSDDTRKQNVEFTRPYLSKPFVWIGNKGETSPDGHTSATIALPENHTLLPHFKRDYPNAQLIDSRNNADSLGMVKQGRAQFTVLNLSTASYYLSRDQSNTLEIIGELPNTKAMAAFGVSRLHPELASILDKALANIEPDQINALTNRWRDQAVVKLSDWHDYQRLILQIILIGLGVAIVFIGWNITLRRQIAQRKSIQQDLSDQLQFLETLVNETPHPIYVRDTEGKLLSCNRKYLEVFNVGLQDVLGKTALESWIKTEKDAQAYLQDYQQVMKTGKALVQDRLLQVGQRVLTIYHWLLPYKNGQGNIQGVIGGWIDVSDRALLLKEIAQAKERAEKANSAKSTFMAMISHEIKTPLNAVIGTIELEIEKTRAQSNNSDPLLQAYQSASDLLLLINDILDTVQIETGHLSIQPETTRLYSLCEDILYLFKASAKAKGLALNFDFDGPDNILVHADRLRLKQILSNLVSNAIKFTSHGTVSLIVTTKPEVHDTVRLTMQVRDTGPGISPDDQARLFNPFEQIRTSSNRHTQGTGLGLYICRQLAQLMGGHLELNSTVNQGTQVTLSLTCLQIRNAPPAIQTGGNCGLRILVTDDHPANRELLADQLIYLGHEVTKACNGQDALNAWTNSTFDVVLTDCSMPVMDGYTLAQEIRRLEKTLDQTPCRIIGVTAMNPIDVMQKCLDHGMNDCLAKPLGLKALRECLGGTPNDDESAKHPQLNLDSLAKIANGNPDDLRQLLHTLLHANTQDLAELESTIQNFDFRIQFELIHRIKGAARMAGYSRLVKVCEQYENCATPEALDLAAHNVSIELRQVINSLEQLLAKNQP